jgi:hypothetical protein
VPGRVRSPPQKEQKPALAQRLQSDKAASDVVGALRDVMSALQMRSFSASVAAPPPPPPPPAAAARPAAAPPPAALLAGQPDA